MSDKAYKVWVTAIACGTIIALLAIYAWISVKKYELDTVYVQQGVHVPGITRR